MNREMPRDNEFQMPSFRLDGRVALVTGGSRGLGLGMALALAHSGADVVVAARGVSDLESAVELIGSTGRRALPLPVDIGNVDAVIEMIRKTEDHFGRLDILVNAAAINLRRPVETFTPEDWDRLMSVNLKGAFFACKEAASVMRKSGKGKIINIGSVAFEIAIPNIALYSISKGGMRQMTRALAVEYVKDNINVNAIAPGRFWTGMTDEFFSVPELYERAVSLIPMGRPGTPSDLAGAAIFLASDASDYITGQTIFVDGGWLAAGGARG